MNITYEQLKQFLVEGKTTREIGNIFNLNYRTISYYIKKWNLNHLQKYKKNPKFTLNTIQTPEEAYFIGFLAADGHISKNDTIAITIAKKDIEVIKFISTIINSNIIIDNTLCIEKKQFPNASVIKKIEGITKFYGGRLKEERSLPNVRKDLIPYLILGFFDADGSILWGIRKDRNRIWQRIQFSSQYNLLLSLQKLLLKYDIPTAITPVKNQNNYIIWFDDRQRVIDFYNILPQNFTILHRKHNKFQEFIDIINS